MLPAGASGTVLAGVRGGSGADVVPAGTYADSDTWIVILRYCRLTAVNVDKRRFAGVIGMSGPSAMVPSMCEEGERKRREYTDQG